MEKKCERDRESFIRADFVSATLSRGAFGSTSVRFVRAGFPAGSLPLFVRASASSFLPVVAPSRTFPGARRFTRPWETRRTDDRGNAFRRSAPTEPGAFLRLCRPFSWKRPKRTADTYRMSYRIVRPSRGRHAASRHR